MSKNSLPVKVLVLLHGGQAVLIWLATIWGATQVLSGNYDRIAPALLLLTISSGFASWATLIAIRLSQLRTWTYTAALVLQATLGSLGVASFLGEFASAPIATVLLIPAGVAILLLSRADVRAQFPPRSLRG